MTILQCIRLQSGRIKSYGLAKCYSVQSASSNASYIHFPQQYPLVYRTIGQQLDLSVESFGDREAVVSCHEGVRYTFSELREKADQLGASFLKLGLKSGDALGIWSPNTANWFVTMMAAARTGLILVGLNPAYQGPEMEYCLKKVKVKAIVAPEIFKTQNYYDILDSIVPEMKHSQAGEIQSKKLPSLKTVIIDSEKKLPGAQRLQDVVALCNSEDINKVKRMQNTFQPDAPCNVQFTSGTTGFPKATMLSHFNYVNNGIQVGIRNELNLKHHRICTQVPLFHAFGILISAMASICHGSTVVLPNAGYNPAASLEAIAKEKCSIIHGTPTMYIDLIAKQNEINLPVESAEIAVTGGAPCSPALFENIVNTFGLKKVKTVFGMTETTAVIFQSLIEEPKDKTLNTVGHIQDHIEAKVIDSNGGIVPFGQPGELCIRGPLNMLEYFDDEQITRETMGKDRWLKTGDKFILHENGYGQIVGRIKEMIIRGGENIFPKEIEDFLINHPNILEVAVIGVPDERMGEECCAFLRLKDDSQNLSQAEIKEFCKGKISHFKIPRFVYVVPNFPKTTSGKVQKFKLKEVFEKLNNK